ncbi:RHS repeat-associated core domain-containing protein, partial [Pseudomonas syringae]|uniref:RHS repeat-associated core domain-containing protein n=1 Tax=Pseudomonas syringae TaxID=317 RepID=UPI000B0A3355
SVLHALDATQGQAFTYSPYGFRPPHLDLPGFNGEQPDPVTGHYLLGNGYRAFNPVLMRFNSPDNLSPFEDGGLNAYAYCVGDPVNRVDPTGHTPALLKMLLRAIGFMRKAKPKPATNINLIHVGAISFENALSRGRRQLNISAHGMPVAAHERTLMRVGRDVLTPDELAVQLQRRGVKVEKFDRVRLLICNSANGGEASFAAEFSRIIQGEVQGFRGKVWVGGGADKILPLIRDGSPKIRRLSDGYYYGKGVRVPKKNPYQRDDPRYKTFNYQPETFGKEFRRR